MAKIALIFDTNEKTMRLMKDGENLADPHYITFSYTGMNDSDGRYKYYMNMEHYSEEKDGMIVERQVRASDNNDR